MEGLASCPKVVMYVSSVFFPFPQLEENLPSDNIGAFSGDTKAKSIPGKNNKVSNLIVDGEQRSSIEEVVHPSPSDSTVKVLIERWLHW